MRPVLATMIIASMVWGCEVIIGADFDRERGETSAPPGPNSDAEADAATLPDGSGPGSDSAAAGAGGLEVFFTSKPTDVIQDVFTNGTAAFWTTLDGAGASPTRVTLHARNVDGSNERIVAAPATSGLMAGTGRCFSIAGAGDSVWLANSADQNTGTILSADSKGENVVERVVSEDTPCVLTLFQGRPYWWQGASSRLRTSTTNGAARTVFEGFQAQHIAADGASLFADALAYVDGSGGHRGVFRLDPTSDGGTAVAPLFTDVPGRIGGLTLAVAHVFWADTASGRILSVPKAGGSATVVASGLGLPKFVAHHESFVYFTTDASDTRNVGTVARIRVLGGNPAGEIQTIAGARDIPTRLAVDATHVYWAEGGKRVLRARTDAK